MNPKQLTQSPTEVQSQSNPQSRLYSLLATLARFGEVRLLAKPVMLMISPYIQPNEYYSRLVRSQSRQASTNESQGMPAAGAGAAAVTTFGNLPLIVLSASLNNIPGWQEWPTKLLQLSSNSPQLFAENSDHNVQIEEPDAAVAAIIQMVVQVRQTVKK